MGVDSGLGKNFSQETRSLREQALWVLRDSARSKMLGLSEKIDGRTKLIFKIRFPGGSIEEIWRVNLGATD